LEDAQDKAGDRPARGFGMANDERETAPGTARVAKKKDRKIKVEFPVLFNAG